MLREQERCRVLCNGKYIVATCVKAASKTVKVRFEDGATRSVPYSAIWKMKKTKHHRSPSDKYVARKRLGRYRRPINVVPTRFSPFHMLGNFAKMLTSDLHRNGICIFNDNTRQWEQAGLYPEVQQAAGGGNAAARPWEYLKHSVGMPTGPFSSLQDGAIVQFPNEESPTYHLATEIIDEAKNRIVRILLDDPSKDTLYMSVNPSDPPDSVKIGLAIFAGSVGTDVVDYISDSIQSIPDALHRARTTGVRP